MSGKSEIVGKFLWCSLKRYRFITDKYDQFKNIYIHGQFSGIDKQNIRIVRDRELYTKQQIRRELVSRIL